jgi:hypothetical protein
LEPSRFVITPPFFAKFAAAAYLVLAFSCAVRSLEFSCGCGTLYALIVLVVLEMDMGLSGVGWSGVGIYLIIIVTT